MLGLVSSLFEAPASEKHRLTQLCCDWSTALIMF